MAPFDVPADISVPEFFARHAAPHFTRNVAGKKTKALAGREFTIQYDVDARAYCLRITDGDRLEIVEGGIDRPMVALRMSEAVWRASVTGRLDGVLDRFNDPSQILDPKRYKKLARLAGTLRVRLFGDGDPVAFDLVFGGAAEPSVEMRLQRADWVRINRGEKSARALLLTGKMKIKGSLPFLLELQALL